jgi:PAS domain S-box-containing protein
MNKDNSGFILAVDDDLQISAYLNKLLSLNGYKVKTFNKSEEALKFLETSRPEIILLDVSMPKIDGFELCKRIKSNPDLAIIPVIFVTSGMEFNTKIDALNLGAVDFITKPFQKEELLARVKTHMNFFRLSELVKSQAIEIAETRAVKELNKELKIAVEKSEQNEKRFRELFEFSNDAIFIHNPEGHILDVNYKACEMLGYSKDELMLKNSFDLFPIEYKDNAAEAYAKMNNEGQVVFENQLLKSDGLKLDVEISARPIADNRTIIQGIARDISDRKKAYKDLVDTKTLLEQTLNQCPVPMVLVSMPDKKFRVINPATVEFLGISDEPSYLNISLFDLKPSWNDFDLDGNPGRTEDLPLSLSLEGKYTHNHERKIIRKDGTVRWELVSGVPIFNANGELIAGYLIMNDITQRKTIEQRLYESEEKYSLAFKTSPDAISINKTDGTFVDVNEGFTKLTGYLREDVVGVSSYNLNLWVDPSDRLKFIEELKANEKVENLETHLCRKDGKVIIALMSANMIMLNGERHILSVTRDISERKEFEQTIKDSEDKFSKAFYSSPACMIIAKISTAEIIDVNYQVLNLLGFERDEIVGHTTLEINLWVDLGQRIDYLQQVVNNIPVDNEEVEFRAKSGKILYTRYSAQKIRLGDEDCILAVFVDISERKNIELELRKAKEVAEENEKRVKSMFSTANTGFVLIDIDGKIIDWNNTFINYFGYTAEEFMSKNSTELTYLEDRKASAEHITKLTTSEIENFRIEKRFTRKDNTIFWADLFASPLKKENKIYAILGVVNDITERKRFENELIKAKENAENSEQKLFQILKQMPYPIEVCDNKGNVLIINQAFLDLYKIHSEETVLINYNFYDDPIINKIDETYQVKKVFEGRVVYIPQLSVDLRNKESKLLEKDANSQVYELLMFPVFNIKNEVSSVVLIWKNITERYQFENDLKRAKEKAEESDLLKSAFLQNMSHEIRTPMNAIIGFSSMLNRQELTEEKRKNYSDIIANSSRQLLSIVTDILTISSLETKQEKINFEPVSVNEIIADLLTIFKIQAANQNITIFSSANLKEKQIEIFSDKTKITQILSNLLINALKFTHEGSIEFGYEIVNNEHKSNSSFLKFHVKDTGIGIDPEQKDKIFERFRQADTGINKRYGGTGLGLSISKGFVELLGGEIWVESELGKGSTFYFTIPYSKIHRKETKSLSEKTHKKQITILVAEDEEFNFLLIEELLVGPNITVLHSTNGEQTVDMCKNNPDIDLVLMDIKMPVMDGHTAAKIIKGFHPDLPIIAQSAYALEHEVKKFQDIFDGYITKPIDEEQFNKVLKDYI